MNLLRERVEALGADAARVGILGRVEMALVGSKDHFGGTKVDTHKPRVVRLALALDGEAVSELAPGSREFAETAKALDKIRRVPLYEMLTEVGVPLQREGQDFRLDWQELVDLVRAEELFIDGLLEDSEDKMGEAAWIRFCYTQAHKDAPCTRVEFEAIRQEFVTSRYMGVMELDHYYSWWRRSQEMMDGDAIAIDGLASANRLLDAWSNDRSPESLKYWLCRNLEVHPRHRPVFEKLVDVRVAATVADAPSSPAA